MRRPRAYAEAADEALVSWSADGDGRAFDEIVRRHGPFALRLAARIAPDRLAAEDIVQEAMVRAWRQSGRFDPKRARFRTWLYRIVVNLCIDRRRRVEPDALPDAFDAADPGAAADEILAAEERGVALAAALRVLPARQRAAMTLVYDEGLSGAEAARVLGLSAKAVERLLARARAALREQMGADHDWKEG
ncbi:MAG TPA: sigma-70 family RNA polymerase sigma factor [Rhodopila sp.]|nr:sigma-70 family RNA polymerase sigma factor [Rhodopila sp.]